MATINKIVVKNEEGKEISLTYPMAFELAIDLLSLVTEEQINLLSLSTKDGINIPVNKEVVEMTATKIGFAKDEKEKKNVKSGTATETPAQKDAQEGCAYLMEHADPDMLYTLDRIRSLLDEGGLAWSSSQVTRRISDLYKTGVLTKYAEKKVTVCLKKTKNADGKIVLNEKTIGSCDKGTVMYQFSVPSQEEE